jgi:hypothetical protein
MICIQSMERVVIRARINRLKRLLRKEKDFNRQRRIGARLRQLTEAEFEIHGLSNEGTDRMLKDLGI